MSIALPTRICINNFWVSFWGGFRVDLGRYKLSMLPQNLLLFIILWSKDLNIDNSVKPFTELFEGLVIWLLVSVYHVDLYIIIIQIQILLMLQLCIVHNFMLANIVASNMMYAVFWFHVMPRTGRTCMVLIKLLVLQLGRMAVSGRLE